MSSEPRRLLFVDHAPIAGGAQLVLAAHIRALDRGRFTPLVACTDAVPLLAERYRAAGAEVHLVPMPRLRGAGPLGASRLLSTAGRLRTLARTLDADLVVANTSRAAYGASLATRAGGPPLIWWVRDFLYGRALFRALRSRARKIICVSDAVRRYYGGAGDSRFETVRVGSDVYQALGAIPASRVAVERARWGFSNEDIVVGFMGRVVADKGPEDVVAAIASLHECNRRVRLLVVGDGRGQPGDVESALRSRVAERGWSSFVRFAGFQREEALYYRCFDLFVHASRAADAYPTSIVQAMMARLPVVATETGGTPELVRDDVTGLLVPPRAPATLAAAVARLVDDPSLRHRFAAAAHDDVMEHNREQVTTAQIERIYDAALASRGPRRSAQAATAATIGQCAS